MERPTWIPEWATNVRYLRGGLWVWEFSGGATLSLAFCSATGEQGPTLNLGHETLEDLLDDVCPEVRRYQQAIDQEKARIASYDAYLEDGE